jgi:hypothetical protein
MRNLILFVLLFFHITTKAQTFSTRVGETYTYKGEYGIPVALSQSHFHLVGKEKGMSFTMDVSVRKTDTTDRIELGKSKKEIKVPSPLPTLLIKTPVGAGIVYQEMDRGGTTGNIMIADVDSNTVAIAEPRVLINLEAAGFTTKLKSETVYNQRIQYKRSPDREYTLFRIYNEMEAASFYLALFDNKMQLKWQLKEQLNFADKDVKQFDAVVDNSGKAYLAYRLDTKGKVNNEGRVLVFDAGKKQKELYLDLPGAIPSEMKLLVSQNTQLVHVAGFYYNYNSQGLQGAYAVGIQTSDLALTTMRKTAFPDNLVRQFTEDGWGHDKSNSKYGLMDKLRSKLVELDNFQPAITGEFSHSGVVNNKLYRYTGGILHAYFGPVQTHFARLPKYRVSAGSTVGDSYSVFGLRDLMIIFYNDDIDNLSKDINSKPENSNVYKNVVMVGAIMQSDGSINRQVVIDMKKDNFLALTDMIQKRGNQFYVPCFEVKSLGGINDNYRPVVVELK